MPSQVGFVLSPAVMIIFERTPKAAAPGIEMLMLMGWASP